MRLSSLFEDLDDKDEFGSPVVSMHYYEGDHTPYKPQRSVWKFEDGSGIYTHTPPEGENPRQVRREIFRDATGSEVEELGVPEEYNNACYYNSVNPPPKGTRFQPFNTEIDAEWRKVMGASLKEDLDDKDEFGSPCGYCADYARAVGDQQRFHEAHEQAEIAAERASWEVQGGWNSSAGRQKYSDIFNTMMFDLGYARRVSRGPWVDKSLKEDLDDRDEFKGHCWYCAYFERNCPPIPNMDEFHHDHLAAEQVADAAWPAYKSTKWPSATTEFTYQRKNWHQVMNAEMQKLGWGSDGDCWSKPLKEDLDDKDEFENCVICPNNEGYLVAPQYQPEEFHLDHIDAYNAGDAARDATTDSDYFSGYDAWIEASRKVMASRGYKRITSIHGQDYWYKIPIKEDLDDKDEFAPNCDACIRNERESGRTLPPDFHIAHTQAEDAVDRILAYTLTWTSGADIAKRVHDAEFNTMHKYGYAVKGVNYDGYKIWVKPSLKEDLDDKDEFDVDPRMSTEINIDEYIVEYWGMNAASDVMLTGAKEYGWVPKSSGRWEQFEDIKTQFPDLYTAAVEVAWNSIDSHYFG